jgi:rhodanese-related sulfurtransferase
MDFFTSFFGGSAVNQVAPEEVQEMIAKSPRPFLLDVRTPEEFAAGHIQGAVLIPLNELQGRLNRVPKDKIVICVCASGSRSSAAARQLEKAGYQVKNMKGGIARWLQAGLPLTKTPAGRVKQS